MCFPLSVLPIDEVYELVRDRMQQLFVADGRPEAPPAYWLIVSNDDRVTCEPLETGLEPTAAFHQRLEEDAAASAVTLVSYLEPHGQPTLFGYVRTRRPDNSGVRSLVINGESDFGPWEYRV